MRFSESDSITPGQMDFVPRQGRSQARGVMTLGIVSIIAVFLLVVLPGEANAKTAGAMAAAGIIAVVTLILSLRKQQNLDLVMSTEYQNLMFAQAAALGSSFCLFARPDGSIVYANDGLKKIFPNFNYSDAMALQGLFTESSVAKADRDRLLNALASGTTDRLVFPITTRDGTRKDYVLTVEPLPRPTGYSVIRGREFHDSRAGTQLMPDMLRSTSAEKIDFLLRSSAVAQYVTDNFGRIEYVNPALELLLGYTPGELAGAGVSIQQLLQEINGMPVPDDYTLAEHRGNAVMRRKPGNLAQVTLEQRVMRDSHGKIVGAAGCLLPYAANR